MGQEELWRWHWSALLPATRHETIQMLTRLSSPTPQRHLDDEVWPKHFGQIARLVDEDWGLLQSRRVFYDDGLEVEFGITTPKWVTIEPGECLHRRVIADGARIILDPTGLLAALLRVVNTDRFSD